jgi:hypothetical protein
MACAVTEPSPAMRLRRACRRTADGEQRQQQHQDGTTRREGAHVAHTATNEVMDALKQAVVRTGHH